MTREKPNITRLVTEGLGYCCLFAFFSLFRRTGIISDRLGVTSAAIRYRKAQFREGKLVCKRCPNCLRSQLKRLKGESR